MWEHHEPYELYEWMKGAKLQKWIHNCHQGAQSISNLLTLVPTRDAARDRRAPCLRDFVLKEILDALWCYMMFGCSGASIPFIILVCCDESEKAAER